MLTGVLFFIIVLAAWLYILLLKCKQIVTGGLVIQSCLVLRHLGCLFIGGYIMLLAALMSEADVTSSFGLAAFNCLRIRFVFDKVAWIDDDSNS
jgi:hypothetical protein